MSVYPDPTAADVAARIGVPADDRVQACIDVAVGVWVDEVDPHRVALAPGVWGELITQHAIKVYEAGTRGLTQYDQGGFQLPNPAATSGLRRSVAGIAQPLLPGPPQGWA